MELNSKEHGPVSPEPSCDNASDDGLDVVPTAFSFVNPCCSAPWQMVLRFSSTRARRIDGGEHIWRTSSWLAKRGMWFVRPWHDFKLIYRGRRQERERESMDFSFNKYLIIVKWNTGEHELQAMMLSRLQGSRLAESGNWLRASNER